MAAMFKRPVIIFCVAVVLLCLFEQSDAKICYRKKYSFGRYTSTTYYCSGTCCGNSCCSGGYYYRYSYSGFGIIPLLIIPCCWCYRRKRLREQQAQRFQATHVAVVSSNYGVNNPGFTNSTATPSGYPAAGPAPYGLPPGPKPQWAASPPSYNEVAGQPPAYSTLGDTTTEKQQLQ